MLAVPVYAESAASSASDDRPPVALRTPVVVAPPGIAGGGLPTAHVRLSLDERGRVVGVVVERLEPPSENDPLFIEAIRDALERWRFAPQRVDGRPVPTELMQTLEIAPAPRPLSAGAAQLGSTVVDPEARRAAYLKLDPPTRQQLLQEMTEQMTGYFAREPVRHATPRFIIVTDADEDTAISVGNNLEAVYGVLAELFADHLMLQGEPLKLFAFIYSEQETYRQMRALSPSFEWSVGYYHPVGVLGFHLEASRPDALLATLLHEATHAFMDRHVVAPGKRLPRWLSEGFAEYVGNSKVKRGKLLLGELRKRRAYLVRDPIGISTTAIDRTAAALDIAGLKRAINDGRALPLDRVLHGENALYFGDELPLFYSTSWLLVHYLVHGEPGWAEAQFPAFVTYVAEGLPAAAAFDATYGLSVERLEERLHRYVARF